MARWSEDAKALNVDYWIISDENQLTKSARSLNDVCILILPACSDTQFGCRLGPLEARLSLIASGLGPNATIITLGETIDLVQVQAILGRNLRYQQWIAIKRSSPVISGTGTLPNSHFGALVHTGYNSSLRHTKTRVKYTYCPTCNKTTKDYGGKKHTYHEYGTLISDVWKDINADLDGNLNELVAAFAEMFGVPPYEEIRVLDCRGLPWTRHPVRPNRVLNPHAGDGWHFETPANQLLLGDCLEHLKKIPDDSIDFAFADPPYNLNKHYLGYEDGLTVTTYFEWCDKWILELTRVLRPGRTVAVLNIPIWAIRHFLFMEQILNFQAWIAWDALAYPVRLIMPAHYAIVCFTKGLSRELPGIICKDLNQSVLVDSSRFLHPMADGFCLRSDCVRNRRLLGVNDQAELTDLWTDIHRLKHNTRRVDHPCQLPAQLMYRLITIFTNPGEVVLDCFNGAGTTTLAADQLGRTYIGIELSDVYHRLATTRHIELHNGIDPFRKAERELTAKNSPVRRMPKQKYIVPKRTLQLEVKRIRQIIGKLPSREDVIKHSKYPIRYYDDYFVSWGEVCAAARTTGMSEERAKREVKPVTQQPALFVFERRARRGIS